EDGIRDFHVTGVQTCALPIFPSSVPERRGAPAAPAGPGRAESSADGGWAGRPMRSSRMALAPGIGRPKTGTVECSVPAVWITSLDRKSVVEGKRGEVGAGAAR